MMARRKYSRSTAFKEYRKLFLLAVEGAVTEMNYFKEALPDNSIIQIECIKGKNQSSPERVLKRMKRRIREQSLRQGDEAWLVLDRDHWEESVLTALYDWSQTDGRYNVALSNPKFESWLLLHFEDGRQVKSSSDCTRRLKRHLPDFDKHFDSSKFSKAMIILAIDRAKAKDKPLSIKWPTRQGSTVYRLVERLIAS